MERRKRNRIASIVETLSVTLADSRQGNNSIPVFNSVPPDSGVT